MNVLIIDDQKAIVESLKKGIHWETLGVNKVYTACSAAEARLILVNFPIEIMISDIEMPEEDGLSLFRWVKEKDMDVCCIFLTSHADFEYAKKAINLGGFEYILQPAKYEEVEAAVLRAVKSAASVKEVKWMHETHENLISQRDIFLKAVLEQVSQGNYRETENILKQLIELLHLNMKNTILYSAQIVSNDHLSEVKKSGGLRLALVRNAFEEVFHDQSGKICVSEDAQGNITILFISEKLEMEINDWKAGLSRYWEFMKKHRSEDFTIFTAEGVTDFAEESLQRLYAPYLKKHVPAGYKGIVWTGEDQDAADTDNTDARIDKVMEYIRTHIYKNISRTEAANLIYLNEEYFSKVFKQYTGWTFKNYVLKEKMNAARQLLLNTNLSVGVIASKLGFDNFSHFSQTFKRLSDVTPQEYRKMHQK